MTELVIDHAAAGGKGRRRRKMLVADLLCGAGGSSTGCQRALAELGLDMELVCVNHWPVAIATHERNHPTARHYVQDIATVRPHILVPEGYLDLLMASPTCTHHSVARGRQADVGPAAVGPLAYRDLAHRAAGEAHHHRERVGVHRLWSGRPPHRQDRCFAQGGVFPRLGRHDHSPRLPARVAQAERRRLRRRHHALAVHPDGALRPQAPRLARGDAPSPRRRRRPVSPAPSPGARPARSSIGR